MTATTEAPVGVLDEYEVEADFPEWSEGFFQQHRYKVAYGGRGAGRSWSAARALLIEGAARPLRVLCTRELQTSIKDSVHQLLTDQIEMLGLPYEVYEREIRHPNGTLFLFQGLRHNVTKIKSIEGVDVCWVEEAERVSDRSWSVLIPTVRKTGSEIWVTFNPDQEDDPTYKRFVKNPPPGAWVVKVSWRDNPWLTDELRAEKDHDYRVDPDAAEHVWGGECRTVSDAQVLNGKWIVEEFEVPMLSSGATPGWNGPYQGSDFGFAQDPSTLVRCWVAPHAEFGPNCLYVEHEAYKIGLELDHTAEHWNRKVPRADDYVTRADNARPESISYLKRHGMPRIEAVEKWPGSVEDGIAHLRSYDKIIIHPRCVHAKTEARLYSYKVDKLTGDVLPVIVDKHNHIIDPIRYALAPLIRRRGLNPGAFTSIKK